jgi:aspartyl-tRNA(Asn)/glutamyl-tRNA(Gln) amidotransferase subunit B
LMFEDYEIVIGLEVHAQLLTQSKLFCGDSASFGAEPNTHISPITMGHPGTLPRLNKEAVLLAIKMGLACDSAITRHNYFARKNYFYPDLPKGYQITQHTTPICVGGHVAIRIADGLRRDVKLNRIHMEEDAGKSLHDVDPFNTAVDYNRAGVPLVEIVTEPDLSSGEEAAAYLTELRKLLRYLGVCDGNMEEGSMRCDANISVRKKGDTKLGTKVEVKNLNSIRNVRRAIEVEANRLIELHASGKSIIQETRSYNAGDNTTFTLRVKEDANDYRYFADPDLTPFHVSDDLLQELRVNIPALPEERVQWYCKKLQLTEYDARTITDEKSQADFFEAIIRETTNYKSAANWILGPLKSYMNENSISFEQLTLQPKAVAELIRLIDEGKLNFSIASTRIFPALMTNPGSSPLAIATEMNLIQDSNENNVAAWVEEVLTKMPDKVVEYRKGKKGLIGLFVGEVKKLSKGKADPKITNDILLKRLTDQVK